MKLFNRRNKLEAIEQQKIEQKKIYEKMYGSINAARKLRNDRQPLFDIVSDIKFAYFDNYDINALKKGNRLTIDEKDGRWVIYQRTCYYGGCDYDPITFTDEYKAYKHAYITSKFLEVNHLYNEGGGPIRADSNTACRDFRRCSGFDTVNI